MQHGNSWISFHSFRLRRFEHEKTVHIMKQWLRIISQQMLNEWIRFLFCFIKLVHFIVAWKVTILTLQWIEDAQKECRRRGRGSGGLAKFQTITRVVINLLAKATTLIYWCRQQFHSTAITLNVVSNITKDGVSIRKYTCVYKFALCKDTKIQIIFRYYI